MKKASQKYFPNRPFSDSEKESQSNEVCLHFEEFSSVHNTGRVEALTPLGRTSRIKMYKNIARSRLFCRIAKRSILGFGVKISPVFWDWVITEILAAYTPIILAGEARLRDFPPNMRPFGCYSAEISQKLQERRYICAAVVQTFIAFMELKVTLHSL